MKDSLKKLDKLVEKGDFIEAIELFFDDNVQTFSMKGEKTLTKNQKLADMTHFLNEIKSIEEITLHDSFIQDAETFSKYTFIFETHGNENIMWEEVIRRKWENGKVVEEEYLFDDFKELKKSLKKEDSKKEKDKKEDSKKDKNKKEKDKKDKGKKEEKSKKSKIKEIVIPVEVKQVVVEEQPSNNLTDVIGIGPKIQEILNKNGIFTFKQLADWKPEDLSAILSVEGKRFQMHDTSTWPEQASQLM